MMRGPCDSTSQREWEREQVLRRKSGVSLSEPVPALYGRTVFKELTSRDLPGLVKRFSDERWVWGDSGLNTGDAGKLATDVTGIYEQDYISAWDAILNDLELVPFSSVQEDRRRVGDPFRPDLAVAQPAADGLGEHIVCRGARISRCIENCGRYGLVGAQGDDRSSREDVSRVSSLASCRLLRARGLRLTFSLSIAFSRARRVPPPLMRS